MPIAHISYRLSIRWVPGAASEPTNTVVLTGARTGVFLDVRFLKDSKKLDWGFAGYRYPDPNAPNVTTFIHHIDSNSRTPDEVRDSGTFITLDDGTSLEVGEMVDPRTGKMASYEETWRDEEAGEADTALFVKNLEGTTWRAWVGRWQLALGRETDGKFWAWRAEECKEGWMIKDSTEGDSVKLLPNGRDLARWVEGAIVKWDSEEWIVLERGRSSE
ncbi:hypothetical protein L208DRAFT_1258955 [Tricholoma matsutake]|nr:hypothetical protein L208DRAFT_1258955 [Tricholoma matsutake 945]